MLKKYKIILAVSFSVLFIGISIFFLDYFLKLRQVNYEKEILYEDSFADGSSNQIMIATQKFAAGIIEPGEVISYAFSIRNSGVLRASDLEINVSIPEIFEFQSIDVDDFRAEGQEVTFRMEEIGPGQDISFYLGLRLKSVAESGTQVEHPAVLIEYKKENIKIFREAFLKKEIKMEQPLLVESSPDFNDSYIKIVQRSDDGSFIQASQIRESSIVYLEVLLKNTGNMDAQDVAVRLEGLQGLLLGDVDDALNMPEDIDITQNSLSWFIGQVPAGTQNLYRFSFEASAQEGYPAIAPYIKISSPSIAPRHFSDAADILREPSFEGSLIQMKSIDGGKIYAQEILQASVIVTNSSENLAENIDVAIELPDGLNAHEGPLFWNIDQIEPGQSVHLRTSLKVSDDIDSDRNVKGILRISSIFLSEDSVYESNQIIISYTKPFAGGTIPIIALHGIEPEAVGKYEISTEAFDAMLRLLKTNGYETISFKDLYDFKTAGKILPEKPVIITSDDGYENIYTHAYPMLLKYDYRMSLFVSTGYIEGTPEKRMMNEFDFQYEDIPRRNMLIWPEIIEMANKGFEIGSQGVTHMRYGDLGFEEVMGYMVDSKNVIEDNIKRNCLFFVWPHDSVHSEALAMMGDIGYLGAIRYKGGPEHTDTIDFYSIRRINIESPMPVGSYADLFMIE